MKLYRFITPFLCVATASAQYTSSSAHVPEDTLGYELKELSVSAFKQMAPLRREPQSATLLNSVQLERLNAVSIKGISDVVPNFFMPDYGSRITSTMYVRGIGARMDQPAVGLNIDNVPYLNKDAYDFDVADIAELQMLRGPQATLYGRNAMAGMINITTLSPFRFQGWRAKAEITSRGRASLGAGWYHRFSQPWGLSFNVSGSYSPGEFRNEHNGEKLDWEKSLAMRSKQQWKVSHSTMINNAMSASWLRQGGYPYESVASGKIAFNDTCFYRRFTFADGLTVYHSADAVALTSVTGVQVIDDNMTLDQDFTPQDFFTLTQAKLETAVSQEVVVRSVDTDSRWRWLSGVFGFYKHLNMQAPVTFKEQGISDLIVSHRNSANPDYPITWNDNTFALLSDFTLPTWGAAAFHQSDLNFGAWTVTAGLRLDYEHAALSYRSRCHTGYKIWHITGEEKELFRDQPIDIDDNGKYSRHFLTLLPHLSVVWSPDYINGNVYAKISKGYKAGGYNTQMFSDVLQQRVMSLMGIGAQYKIDEIVGYKPEYSWNGEIGTHLDIANGGDCSFPRGSFDLTAFLTLCRDQQITVFPSGNTTGRMMANAGRTRNWGGEASLSLEFSSSMAVNASYGFTEARFRRFFNGITDFKGKHVPYVPKNTVFLQAVWNHNFGRSTNLSVDMNMRATGKIYWNEENTQSQPFYVLLGAGAILTKGKVSLQVWGRNLTNTNYYTFYFLSMGREFRQRGKGPEGGVTLQLTL